jgi:predicted methyltransferase
MIQAPFSTRRAALALLAGAPLAACGQGPVAPAGPPPEPGSLEWAAAGRWRIEPERDVYQHPVETLRFWGVEPWMTVLEILPGRGWMTTILAPYLARGHGHLIVAGFDPHDPSPARQRTRADFDARFANAKLFGEIERSVALPAGAALARDGAVDLAILANNVHTLMAEGAAERTFAGVFAALAPGAVFGVEQHRGASSALQDPLASDGYVQEAYVRQLAQEAGFAFVAASDVNANPKDTREHPFGVWTLPPTLRTSPLGQPDNPSFDTAPYAAIGESDRMTLKFRKPAADGEATHEAPADAASAP